MNRTKIVGKSGTERVNDCHEKELKPASQGTKRKSVLTEVKGNKYSKAESYYGEPVWTCSATYRAPFLKGSLSRAFDERRINCLTTVKSLTVHEVLYAQNNLNKNMSEATVIIFPDVIEKLDCKIIRVSTDFSQIITQNEIVPHAWAVSLHHKSGF